ncbi:DUF192 domain-containing protein [Novosphingobium album (ex Liu et al. 2023)]|uniref:DUF192 domain-containing protein n=1 Tax=Novosphingobium album (ex Liu et al. 2023) TaxID=3031130 RepID=A0ABT5WRN7_9SPHN|nr:DUF192 domain-containing protein [Novosphingobium album (ex Liu et al. 2023)]MDE8652703.1 DUF192 domain-containing protein [Novosphingobium album (ex Liu et al. 2023)]
MRLLHAALAMTLAIVACSPDSQNAAASAATAAPAVHPESGLPVIALTVRAGGATGATGKAHEFRVEVARTESQQARGLMFRTAMGPDEGMLFPMDPPRQATFWMRNTVIPLDLLFIGPDHRVLNIAANAVPYSEDRLPSAGLAAAVLELNGGRAAELGIKPGDKVEWNLPKPLGIGPQQG